MKFAPRMVRAAQFHRCLRARSAHPEQPCKSSLHFTARRASGSAITLDLSGRHTRRPHFLVLPASLLLMFRIHPAHVNDTLVIGDYVFFDFHLDSFCDRPLFVFGHDFHHRSSKSIPPTVFFSRFILPRISFGVFCGGTSLALRRFTFSLGFTFTGALSFYSPYCAC